MFHFLDLKFFFKLSLYAFQHFEVSLILSFLQDDVLWFVLCFIEGFLVFMSESSSCSRGCEQIRRAPGQNHFNSSSSFTPEIFFLSVILTNECLFSVLIHHVVVLSLWVASDSWDVVHWVGWSYFWAFCASVELSQCVKEANGINEKESVLKSVLWQSLSTALCCTRRTAAANGFSSSQSSTKCELSDV